MFRSINPQVAAILQALLVTFLWSTSWVLIKIGLKEIPALPFAGLRYMLAFLLLLPFYLRARNRMPTQKLSRRDWAWLTGLGLVYYTLTQGTQFLALSYLPAITFSLLLNFSAPLVALLGIPLLKEKVTPLQWGGIGIFLLGVAVYFYPVFIPAGLLGGFLVAAVSVGANSLGSIMGRFVNREGRMQALTVTVVSMGIGATVLLVWGVAAQGWPDLDLQSWGIILWLAVVNTAFAFTLWNHTLRTLTATQSSMINNTMMVQIGILAWLFLGETLTWVEGLGLVLAVVGALLVNLRRSRDET